ncbi:hypothetical protein [Arenimonas caeni]|uniref:Lipoprotein n=1 Tax=Arenimonas caeni TaxID=2058085 RepID=A0A2P6M9U0_9GAMM|nr:hypothetical protein [Arenimonas caeni]MDY0023035.1 hypothetical protein [Arenimonas caeni]PRH82766.1 hypothetical protein C6N40_06040 [Arenimonas caeni]
MPLTFRPLTALLALSLATACASTPATLDESNSAELAFADPGSPGGLPGRFTALDGRHIAGLPAVIRVPAGKHTIEYNCPDTITMDTYPTVKSNFEAGRSYVLECTSGGSGRIVER